MSREVALKLVAELDRQFGQVLLDEKQREGLVTAFETTPIPESSRFDEEPAGNQEYTKCVHNQLEGEGRMIDLYPNRIIRNANAGQLNMNFGKYLRERVWAKLGLHSSTFTSRHLRQDDALVKLMLASAEEAKAKPEMAYKALSALFRFKQEDIESTSPGRSALIEIDRPVLIIPGITPAQRKMVEGFEFDEGYVDITMNHGRLRGERRYTMSYGMYVDGLKSGNLPHLKK